MTTYQQVLTFNERQLLARIAVLEQQNSDKLEIIKLRGTSLEYWRGQVAALEQKNKQLRQELEDHIRAFEQYEHWLDTMPAHLIETSNAALRGEKGE